MLFRINRFHKIFFQIIAIWTQEGALQKGIDSDAHKRHNYFDSIWNHCMDSRRLWVKLYYAIKEPYESSSTDPVSLYWEWDTVMNILCLFYSYFTQHRIFFRPTSLNLYWVEWYFNEQSGSCFMEGAMSPADCGWPVKTNLASFLCLAPEKRQALCDWHIQCL